MIKWLFGIPYEVAFWESTYANKDALNSLFRFSHLGQLIHLDGFDAQSFLLRQEHPLQAKVLDVGCGMTFFPGDYIILNGEKKPINIHYVDPLASYYNNIAQKHHVSVPEVEFGMMEYLSSFYPKQDVSLIIIQNALDHSANPIKGIIEAINALQIDGVLYLNHHPNEAECENYRGFHQFNITIEDSKLIIWNKEQRYDVNDIVRDFAIVKTQLCDKNPVAILTKKKAVPTKLLNFKQDIRTLSNALLDFSHEVLSSRSMFRYHAHIHYYRFAQRIAKLFSWQKRQSIKKFLKKINI